jgi:hypothetical protein
MDTERSAVHPHLAGRPRRRSYGHWRRSRRDDGARTDPLLRRGLWRPDHALTPGQHAVPAAAAPEGIRNGATRRSSPVTRSKRCVGSRTPTAATSRCPGASSWRTQRSRPGSSTISGCSSTRRPGPWNGPGRRGHLISPSRTARVAGAPFRRGAAPICRDQRLKPHNRCRIRIVVWVGETLRSQS